MISGDFRGPGSSGLDMFDNEVLLSRGRERPTRPRNCAAEYQRAWDLLVALCVGGSEMTQPSFPGTNPSPHDHPEHPNISVCTTVGKNPSEPTTERGRAGNHGRPRARNNFLFMSDGPEA